MPVIGCGSGTIDAPIFACLKKTDLKERVACRQNLSQQHLAVITGEDEEIAEGTSSKTPQNSVILASTLANAGKKKEAVTVYNTFLETHPEDASAHFEMGILKIELNDFKGGLASFEEAVRIRPAWATAHYFRGLVLDALGYKEEKIAAFRKAVENNPEYIEAHYQLGLALYDSGATHEASKSFKKAVRYWEEEMRQDPTAFRKDKSLVEAYQKAKSLVSYNLK